MWRRLVLAGCLLAGCNRKVNFEAVTVPSGREFNVEAVEELPDYRGHCALKVTYLTEEDQHETLVKDAGELTEEYWGDHRATRCGVILINADHIMQRFGGLFSQTQMYQVVFDLDGAGHWRRAQ